MQMPFVTVARALLADASGPPVVQTERNCRSAVPSPPVRQVGLCVSFMSWQYLTGLVYQMSSSVPCRGINGKDVVHHLYLCTLHVDFSCLSD